MLYEFNLVSFTFESDIPVACPMMILRVLLSRSRLAFCLVEGSGSW